MIDIELNFETREVGIAALRSAGLTRRTEGGEETIVYSAQSWAIDEIGEIPGRGWTVNLRATDSVDVSTLAQYRAADNNPVRVWA